MARSRSCRPTLEGAAGSFEADRAFDVLFLNSLCPLQVHSMSGDRFSVLSLLFDRLS